MKNLLNDAFKINFNFNFKLLILPLIKLITLQNNSIKELATLKYILLINLILLRK